VIVWTGPFRTRGGDGAVSGITIGCDRYATCMSTIQSMMVLAAPVSLAWSTSSNLERDLRDDEELDSCYLCCSLLRRCTS
jgi:hypothetical protein